MISKSLTQLTQRTPLSKTLDSAEAEMPEVKSDFSRLNPKFRVLEMDILETLEDTPTKSLTETELMTRSLRRKMITLMISLISMVTPMLDTDTLHTTHMIPSIATTK
jgi:hypothetical protein